MSTMTTRVQRPFNAFLAVGVTVAAAMIVAAVGVSVFVPRPVVTVPEPQLIAVSTPAPTAIPTPVPTAVSTPSPTPVPTATPTPSPTPTPENKPGQPGSCLVLEQRYCGTGDLVIQGTAIGFNIPPGTPIFAPFDGTKETGTKAGKYRVVLVTVYSDDKHDKIVLDVEMWPVDVSITGSTVKKGEVIAKTSSIVVSEAGNYNLAVRPSVGSFTAPEVETFVKPFYKSLKL